MTIRLKHDAGSVAHLSPGLMEVLSVQFWVSCRVRINQGGINGVSERKTRCVQIASEAVVSAAGMINRERRRRRFLTETTTHFCAWRNRRNRENMK